MYFFHLSIMSNHKVISLSIKINFSCRCSWIIMKCLWLSLMSNLLILIILWPPTFQCHYHLETTATRACRHRVAPTLSAKSSAPRPPAPAWRTTWAACPTAGPSAPRTLSAPATWLASTSGARTPARARVDRTLCAPQSTTTPCARVSKVSQEMRRRNATWFRWVSYNWGTWNRVLKVFLLILLVWCVLNKTTTVLE